MSDPNTSVVPADLTQEWPSGRHVSGKNEDLIGFEAPTSDGHGGYTNTDGEPVDEHGNLLPDPNAPKGDPGEPDLRSYDVSPGQMYDAETTILQATTGQIADFERFRDAAIAKSSWIFWAGKESDAAEVWHEGAPLNNNVKWIGPYDDGSGWYANYRDPHPEQTAEIQYSQFQLLQGCAGVLDLVGQFVGRLNNAAQIYAGADINSTVPDGTSTA
ncbi:hypothetical protein HNR22_001727 [Micromonospora jinlongensis]|uniref:Uncharacterized protein n=1 Tax=Micromonospora jinlongensis TaxID=1287877 RepID=A0A7Y9X0Z7_9ACTN|nr:hypothetical protein [Micromonospora jinlongensis]NYH42000.1 hypothetical protein [Micromonospora jinlongensis]